MARIKSYVGQQQDVAPRMNKSQRKAYIEAQQNFAKQLLKIIKERPETTINPTYSSYTKERYRTLIVNPATNQNELMEMSRFLYRVSMPYRRLIRYFASKPQWRWYLTPLLDTSGTIKDDQVIKNYTKAAKLVNDMGLNNLGEQILTNVLLDGVFFGYVYSDKNSFFVSRLDPKYCRIKEVEDGCFNFAFNFAFFDQRNYSGYEELWGAEFKQKYNAYKNDRNLQWQVLDPDKSICIKDDWFRSEEVIPPFVGLFEALLDLIDSRALQRNKDTIQNYKLILQKIPYLNKTQHADDFALEAETAREMYEALADIVPEAVGIGLTAMDSDVIDFEPDDHENDILANSMKNVFNESGTSRVLFGSDVDTQTAIRASIDTDLNFIWTDVKAIERWVARYIKYQISGTMKYHFEVLMVSTWNEIDYLTAQTELTKVGVPNKIRLAAATGINAYQLLGQKYLENDILNLPTEWKPPMTSYTMSAADRDVVNDDQNDTSNQEQTAEPDEGNESGGAKE